MRHLQIEIAEDGIACLVMNNADEAVNLVSEEFIAEMEDAIAVIAADNGVKGVILKSGKPAFMAGADLKLLVGGHGWTLQDACSFSQKASAMHRAIECSGKPWVALVTGAALGGGFELALACHYRILEDSPKSVVGLPEVNWGLLPGSGGTQRLIRIGGIDIAVDLLLSGRMVKGAEALDLRIVDAVVPRAEMDRAAREWLAADPDPIRPWDVKGYRAPGHEGLRSPEQASRMMVASAGLATAGYNNPAPLAILSCIFEGAILPFDKALGVESKYFAQLATSPVSRNVIRTTFLSKLAAERGARRPEGFAKAAFSKVGVLGAGMMGAGIALVSAQAGCEVVLLDRDPAIAEAGKGYAESQTAKQVKRGSITGSEREAILGRIYPTDDFAALQGCDIVIEAVFEDIDIKAETTRRAEAAVGPGTLFCSNTSTLPITRLAQASQRPEQFIGMHFFSPVDRMGLVELIKGRHTSAGSLSQAIDFVAKLRKTPIVVNDSRGFYTSRVFQTFIHEGAAMLRDGVPPAVIENAARSAGMAVGPLALLDELTFDLPLKIVDQAIEQEGGKYVRPAGVDVLRTMKGLGRSGRKAGGGFYEYSSQGAKQLWSGLSDAFPADHDFDVAELKRRFLHIQALEAARCLEENVIETCEDGDLGAVYGWSFPSWTGGPLSYIDTVGVDQFVSECDQLAQKCGARFAPSPWLRSRAAAGTSFY